MKKIITLITIFIGIFSLAQEAGRKGELLKNQVSAKEIQTSTAVGSLNRSDSSLIRILSKNNEKRNIGRFNWNQNTGYSEVFVRIPEEGYFSVEVDNQMISSPYGKFRFFDLRSGNIMISIYENNYLIYRSQLNVKNNTRLVLDFFTNYGLYLLETYRVQVQAYGFDQWDDLWNNPYNNSLKRNYTNNSMDGRSFENFVQTLKRNATFDKDKVIFIEQQTQSTSFSSLQIKTLLESFSFDDSRLQAAKFLYQNCSDIQYFYVVYDAFTFDKNKKELMNFVNKKK